MVVPWYLFLEVLKRFMETLMFFLSINRITYQHEWYLMRTIVGKPFTFSIDIGLLFMKHSWALVSVHYMTLSKIRILPTVQTSSTTQQLQNEKNQLKNWSSLWNWGVFPICCQGTNCIKLTRVWIYKLYPSRAFRFFNYSMLWCRSAHWDRFAASDTEIV